MPVFKCKMCGGSLEIKNGETIAKCEYCGSVQTVPFLDTDKKTRIYSRALDYRLDNDFDRAYNAYETIINDDPTEAEAYWGLVLSEYGVEYVTDNNGKRIPTCHRTSLKSITSNENFKKVLEYADSENKLMYEEEAKVLDSLQKNIISVSCKEEPYDIFICYKEQDNENNRTKDSVVAQDIYDQLTSQGLRVFFSRISLEDKLGKDYEPYIFNALRTSKVMLLITSSNAYCNAVWVKNEWSRYLDFMKNDSEKTIVPVLIDMTPYELPDELQKFQCQNMNKLGAMQDLIRGIKKIVGIENYQSVLDKESLNELLKEREKRKSLPKKIIFSIVLAILFLLGLGLFSGEGKLFIWPGGQRLENISGSSILRVNSFIFYFVYVSGICSYISVIINVFKGMKNKVANIIYNIVYIFGGVIICYLIANYRFKAYFILLIYFALGILCLISNVFIYKKNVKLLIIFIFLNIIASGSVLYINNHRFMGGEDRKPNSTKQLVITNDFVNVRDDTGTIIGVVYKDEIYTFYSRYLEDNPYTNDGYVYEIEYMDKKGCYISDGSGDYLELLK